MPQTIEIQPLANASPGRMKYWGGFFDEQPIFFDINQQPDTHPRASSITFQPILKMVNPSEDFLASLKPVFPGILSPHNQKVHGKVYEGWDLTIGTAVECFNFIRAVKPHLVFIRPQADVFEEFLLQKQEVRRVLENLKRVPRMYATPEDRVLAEEGFRQRLLVAKAETIKDAHVPEPERLAGIFDANVFLGIYETQRKGVVDYEANGGLTSVHKGLLDGLHNEHRGSEPTESYKREGRYAGPSYLWQLSGQNWLPFLDEVIPHLIFKRAEAELVRDFLLVQGAFSNQPTSDPIIEAKRSQVLHGYVESWQELIAA